MPRIQFPKRLYVITPKQRELIDLLAIELTFNDHQKKQHIRSILNKPIDDLDSITSHEAGMIITQFKEWKIK